jgi:hypothetical protein
MLCAKLVAGMVPWGSVLASKGLRILWYSYLVPMLCCYVQAINKIRSGWHSAMYVADFSSVYKRLESAGLIDNDHPFRDKCYNLEDALRNKQLRFKDFVEPKGVQSDAGAPAAAAAGKQQKQQLLYRFEHEIRSLHHPRFMRPLYNRLGSNFDVV